MLRVAVLQALLSAIGCVANEKLFKAKEHSLHLQNLLLYTWGIALNLASFLTNGSSLGVSSMFTGYNVWTWILIVNNSLIGLSISAILLPACRKVPGLGGANEAPCDTG